MIREAKMKKETRRTLVFSPGGGYVMILRSVGNPDFAQYAPVSEPTAIKGRTLTAMRDAAREYIEFWNLGGGNWPETEIRTADGRPVAWISYNGRLWDCPSSGPDWKEAKEIVA